MAKCKYCGRGGLFFSVDKNGVCRDCAAQIYPVIQSHTRRVQESLDIIQRSKQPRTIASRRDVILESLEYLESEFESKGIPIYEVGIAKLREDIGRAADDLLLVLLAEEAKKVDAKAAVADTPKQKASHFKRFLTKVIDFETLLSDPGRLAQLKADVVVKVREQVVRDLIIKAQKYEFKGNLKKAKEVYMDALFELKHDDVPNELQKDLIHEVEDNLRRLDATLGTGDA